MAILLICAGIPSLAHCKYSVMISLFVAGAQEPGAMQSWDGRLECIYKQTPCSLPGYCMEFMLLRAAHVHMGLFITPAPISVIITAAAEA